MKYERSQKFRQETYQMLGKAEDATFELMDSIMTTKNASCLAEFSLSPLFRRKWSSTYEALQGRFRVDHWYRFAKQRLH